VPRCAAGGFIGGASGGAQAAIISNRRVKFASRILGSLALEHSGRWHPF